MGAELMYWVGPMAAVAAWTLLTRYVRPGTPVRSEIRAFTMAMQRLQAAVGTSLLPAVERATEAMREFRKVLAEGELRDGPG